MRTHAARKKRPSINIVGGELDTAPVLRVLKEVCPFLNTPATIVEPDLKSWFAARRMPMPFAARLADRTI
jgi:hypothetical protein